MLIEVKLLGELGRRFGRSYSFVAHSPKDVISALSYQLDGFKQYLMDAHERNIAFKLVNDTADGMDYEQVLMPCKRLVIAPVVAGGGTAGKILLGIGLIALSFVSFGSTAFAGVGAAFKAGAVAGTASGSMLAFKLGATLLFSGIAELLAPSPSGGDDKESFLFDRADNTTSQGTPVPVLYGKFLATSPAVVSSSVTTYQVPA
jgi:predicted phage tail protein